MLPNRVAILSHDDDVHLPFVTRYLRDEPLIINAGNAPDGGLTYWTRPDSPWPRVIYRGELLDLEVIGGVWYRGLDVDRLRPLVELEAAPEPIRDYAKSSLNRLGWALADLFPNAFWVSDRQALIHADSKLRQLVMARRLGFTTPATVFTSDPEQAAAFLKQQGVCVIKPLAIRPPVGYNQYTKVLRYADAPNLSAIRFNPHILQQLVEHDFELRVTVVGEAAFASMVGDIKAEAAEAFQIRDWKYGCERDTFQAVPFELPPGIAWLCVELVRRLGLRSGMIDLVVKQGRYFFLEINGNGQWAFVDDETVEKIGRALARLLEEGW